ncbi:helix-turn-helix transcriptional regulator [Profundibacterium mesophilum]|uniref:Response regulator n=1 Tax=Profundibacterium mesophilum KAUST100406-0324 TaxID=1037889 RepID=A0A921NQG0_9RHOB|nr:autoinducer binding domain-containing protein [Profundibacterium mesophilum]KAF0675317.1 Response regulator [Profundibacterium mesophilum KAUST100406-0324]
MQKRLHDIIEHVSGASNIGEIGATILGLTDVLDVEHIAYHSVNGGGEYASSTYKDDWIDCYLGNGYSRIDPVVQAGFTQFGPVNWNELDWSGKSARAFMGEAQSAGVGNQGLSIPIRGPRGQFALFTVSQRDSIEGWKSYTDNFALDLVMLAHVINQKALELDTVQGRGEIPRLSPREADALTLLAGGMNRAQSADYLRISEHTLRVYIESARFKLKANNTTHAVARAICLGMIAV